MRRSIPACLAAAVLLCVMAGSTWADTMGAFITPLPTLATTDVPAPFMANLYVVLNEKDKKTPIGKSQQTILALITGNYEAEDDYSRYNVTFTGIAYGDRYYLASDNYWGPGVGYLVATGSSNAVDLVHINEEYPATFLMGVVDVFLDLRLGPIWVEPSLTYVTDVVGITTYLVPNIKLGLFF